MSDKNIRKIETATAVPKNNGSIDLNAVMDLMDSNGKQSFWSETVEQFVVRIREIKGKDLPRILLNDYKIIY